MHNLRTFFFFTFIAIFATLPAVFSQAKSNNGRVLVLNKQADSLTILDAKTMKTLGTVNVGGSPHEVVASPDGKTAYVANYGSQTPGSTLSVVDIASLKEVRRVDISPLMRPHGIQEIGGKIYFSAETNRAIARYDPATNKVDWIMGTGQNASHMVVGSFDQTLFYTANIASNNVTAFELQSVPPAGSRIFQIPVGKQPEAIDMAPNKKEVWVGLNAEAAIDIVDTVKRKVVNRVELGARPYRVRFAPNGKRVYSTLPNTKEIVVTDADTKAEIKRIKLENFPLGITFSKDSKLAYVTTVQQDSVLKIDLEKLEVIAKGETGAGPDGVALAGF